jgi:hypothetical protein
MTTEPKSIYHGTPLSEAVENFTYDIQEDNGIGLWAIVPYGHYHFQLNGNDLIDFVRRTILALIAKGGRPVIASQTQPIWEETFQYGTKPEEIADNVIAQWISEGAPDRVEWGRWWFAYPGCHR